MIKKRIGIIVGILALMLASLAFFHYKLEQKTQRLEKAEQMTQTLVAEAKEEEKFARYPNVFSDFALIRNQSGTLFAINRSYYKNLDQQSYLVGSGSILLEGTKVTYFNQLLSSELLDSFADKEVLAAFKKTAEVKADTEVAMSTPAFYHPAVNYTEINQDFSKLDDLPPDSLVEIGLSFSTSYTKDELLALLPADVQPTFYWLDVYDEDYLKSQTQPFQQLVGAQFFKNTELQELLQLDYFTSSDSLIFDQGWLKAAQKEGKISVNQSEFADYQKIIGATFIQTPAELKQLLPLLKIRGASLGLHLNYKAKN